MPLTVTECKNAAPSDRDRKLADGLGLYLLVKRAPNGSKLWRAKIRVGGRETTASYGAFPEVSLKEARELHLEARRKIRAGVDPNAIKRTEREAEKVESETFKAIAEEWFAGMRPAWKASHSSKIEGRLKNHVYPKIGSKPIRSITSATLLKLVRSIDQQETRRRCLQVIGQVFRFAIATDRADTDPTYALRGVLPKVQVKHHAGFTEPADLGAFLRAAEEYDGTVEVKAAMRILPHVFVRNAELRKAEWIEVDLGGSLWTIPGGRMKSGGDHLVPLSRQVVAIIAELYDATGRGRYVFPSRGGSRPLSDGALGAALRRMDYTSDVVTPHGFRATARTLLDQELGVAPQVIEHQLAHAVPDALGAAYNRTKHLRERVRMMQAWSDYLDRLRKGGDVVQLQRKARRS